MSRSDTPYYLAPNEQDLLVAALASNQPSNLDRAPGKNTVLNRSEKDKDSKKQGGQQNLTNDYFNQSEQSAQSTATPGQFLNTDDLGFDLDADGDDQYDFDSNGQFIGDFPGESSQVGSSDLHDKRKSIGDQDDDDDDGGGKRRESEGGTGKKPGRKPLTAEPTSVSPSS
jgi:AP-1-like transcription factor